MNGHGCPAFLIQIGTIILVMSNILETLLDSIVVVFALEINIYVDFLSVSRIFDTFVCVS